MRRTTVPTFEVVATPEGDKGVTLPKEWQAVVEDTLTCLDRGLLDNVPPSEYIQNIANALYALANKPHRDLTDVEIWETYSRGSLCSFDAGRVMAGYRAIIAADRAIRAALTDTKE